MVKRASFAAAVLFAAIAVASGLSAAGCATPLTNRQLARFSVSVGAAVGMVALLSLAAWCTQQDSRCGQAQ